MTIRTISIIVLALSATILLSAVAVNEFRYQSSPEVAKCPENTVPSFHPGECRPLLPIETDTTFPWGRQQAEAQDFFREFQKNVGADRRKEVAAMMMYPLRVHHYNDEKAADYRFLNSPSELLNVYDKVFHKSVKDYIANYDASEVWGNDYFLQTRTGAIGIYCTTIGQCPACNFEFRVKIIHSDSIYRDTIEDIFGRPSSHHPHRR